MLRILPLLPALVYIYASWIHHEDVGVSDFIKRLCLFINLSDLYFNCTCVTLTIWWSVMCYPNRVDIIYTPILTQYYLYRLRRSGHSHFRLNRAAWRAACEAGVALHRPNRRGSRGGARKQRPIFVIVSMRPTVAPSGTNCINDDNITCVSVASSPLMESTLLCPLCRLPLTRLRAAVSRYRLNWTLSTLVQFATKPMVFLRIT